MRKRKTVEEFIEKANAIHNNKYNYSNFIYLNNTTKGIIFCPIHGNFEQTPSNHLFGFGCRKCGSEQTKTIRFGHIKREFIERSKVTHSEFYDYSKVEYINNSTPVIIICPKHGEFKQKPIVHLKSGCPKCGKKIRINKRTKSLEDFIIEANIVHNDKYDYSKATYVNARTKIKIICPKHGEFEQTPYSHLSGCGCALCYGNVRKSKDQFINEANKIHNNKYDYLKVNYKNIDTRVIIVCPEHGEFEQSPYHHLEGSGCLECRNKKLNGLFKKHIEKFIEQAHIVHGNKYDYSNFIYINDSTKGIIVCPKHGKFFQTPSSHLRGNGCSRCGRTVSKKSQKWLDSFNNPTIEREKVIKIGSKIYKVDGFDHITNTVYEFYGDFWHGNPEIFNPNDVNRVNKKLFGQLYKKTIEKEVTLKSYGYNLIYIWESIFDKSTDGIVPSVSPS